jgi:hypothetical protein
VVRRGPSPAGSAGTKSFGTADFGAPAGAATVSAPVVLADDGAAPTSDGCTALINGGAMNGKIALIDRGTCAFTQKALAAQNAGAIACVIVNNVAGSAPGLGGSDPSVTIPTVSLSLADGNAIKANLAGGVTMSIGPNPAFLAGADDAGRVLVYAPNPIESGSSISHWDVTAEPSLLMEPFITEGLSSTVDLTRYAFEDIGWFSPRTTDTIPSGPIPARRRVPEPVHGHDPHRLHAAARGHAEVTVFDIAGRLVKHLVSQDLPAGSHTAIWDGSDDGAEGDVWGVLLPADGTRHRSVEAHGAGEHDRLVADSRAILEAPRRTCDAGPLSIRRRARRRRTAGLGQPGRRRRVDHHRFRHVRELPAPARSGRSRPRPARRRIPTRDRAGRAPP